MRRPARIFAIAAAFAALLALAAAPAPGLAHPGQLSPKDGCHKHKAAGERHWHEEGGATRGGACIKRDGERYRVLEIEAAPAAPALPWEACRAEWGAVEAHLAAIWTFTLPAHAGALMGCLRAAYPKRE